MKPADIFKLVVRIFGVYLLYQTVMSFAAFVSMMFGSRGMVEIGFVQTLLMGGASVWFLFGASPIDKWAYPEAQTGVEPKRETVASTVEAGPLCISCGKPTRVGSKICPACGWTQP